MMSNESSATHVTTPCKTLTGVQLTKFCLETMNIPIDDECLETNSKAFAIYDLSWREVVPKMGFFSAPELFLFGCRCCADYSVRGPIEIPWFKKSALVSHVATDDHRKATNEMKAAQRAMMAKWTNCCRLGQLAHIVQLPPGSSHERIMQLLARHAFSCDPFAGMINNVSPPLEEAKEFIRPSVGQGQELSFAPLSVDEEEKMLPVWTDACRVAIQARDCGSPSDVMELLGRCAFETMVTAERRSRQRLLRQAKKLQAKYLEKERLVLFQLALWKAVCARDLLEESAATDECNKKCRSWKQCKEKLRASFACPYMVVQVSSFLYGDKDSEEEEEDDTMEESSNVDTDEDRSS